MSRVAHLPFMKILIGLNAMLGLLYISLIAIIMSYAASHVEFAQEVRSGEAEVASLEAEYFGALSRLTATDFQGQGYEKPSVKTYVTGSMPTAFTPR